MGDKYIIGVDQGTQSTKIVIFNQRGEIINSVAEPLKPLISRQPGYAEHPDDDLWESLKIALRRIMKEFEGKREDIVGLGLCSIRCCRVFMRSDGNLFSPVMNWMDVRAYQKYEDDPDISYTCPPTGYLTYRLTGELKDTAANQFQWQFPIDLDTWQWSKDEEYFNSFNIPRKKLFELKMPGDILGYVNEKAAQETGIPAGIPVVATANDKAVEALGAGLIDSDVALISLGTYIASMVCGNENKPFAKNFWTNLSCIPYKYLYESNGIRIGMGLITWYKNIIGEEYAKKAKHEGYSVEDYLAKEAANVSAGSDGLLTIPDWLAPASQQYRKGIIIGFDRRHTRGHIYRSLLEGIAMTLKNHYDPMIEELGIKPKYIIISGGGSNSDLFMQIFADVFGVETVRNVVNGAASLGAAICVAVATGLYNGFEEAVRNMVRQKDKFLPNEKNYKIYRNINTGVYHELPKLVEEALKTMYNVFN
ncbi:FGGY-family carbohydrate kinase [Thermovenabulum sp.]|uniref:FGGY-family carbohydrate kinase n=1 Tax=Thermovenabulum sp. TaxID=3100335 RepID=UPI003C7ADD9F